MTGLFELGPFRPIEAKRGSYPHEEPKAQPTSAFIPLPLLSLELTALTSAAAAAAAASPLPRRLTRLLFVDPIPPSGPRWKKGKDGKDFGSLAAAHPMSTIVSELKASFISSTPVAILSGPGGSAVLGVQPEQAVILNRAAFGHAIENATAQKHWFQLSPEEVFYLCHALNCIRVDSLDNKQMSEIELWDYFRSGSESFPEMYKAYAHLRLKNWVVRSGLQYGADFVAYRHHPVLVHSEFAVVVVPEGAEFGNRCGRLEVWSDLLCALRASGSVAKTLLVLTISGSSKCELSSPDCLEQLVVLERTITRWIPQQCREQRCEPSRDEVNREELIIEKESVLFNHWVVILGFTVLSSLLVYRLKFRQ
uniref:tRNA-intron lyase n=1 Tax=Oryza meridionalis TaxID=40149 RepID=A0A0E0E2I9_9ORYZ